MVEIFERWPTTTTATRTPTSARSTNTYENLRVRGGAPAGQERRRVRRLRRRATAMSQDGIGASLRRRTPQLGATRPNQGLAPVRGVRDLDPRQVPDRIVVVKVSVVRVRVRRVRHLPRPRLQERHERGTPLTPRDRALGTSTPRGAGTASARSGTASEGRRINRSSRARAASPGESGVAAASRFDRAGRGASIDPPNSRPLARPGV